MAALYYYLVRSCGQQLWTFFLRVKDTGEISGIGDNARNSFEWSIFPALTLPIRSSSSSTIGFFFCSSHESLFVNGGFHIIIVPAAVRLPII